MDKENLISISRRKLSVKQLLLTLACMACLSLTGCGIKTIDEEKLSELEYTVTPSDKLPQQLLSLVDEKKQKPFKLTYQDDGYLYILEGYGEKKGSGYSIQVGDVYRSDNAIYFSSTLMGPEAGEAGADMESYPFVAIKLEYMDDTVVFQ